MYGKSKNNIKKALNILNINLILEKSFRDYIFLISLYSYSP